MRQTLRLAFALLIAGLAYFPLHAALDVAIPAGTASTGSTLSKYQGRDGQKRPASLEQRLAKAKKDRKARRIDFSHFQWLVWGLLLILIGVLLSLLSGVLSAIGAVLSTAGVVLVILWFVFLLLDIM